MGLKVGDAVGDYSILGPVASGGMGEVFKAEHTITRRVDAVKVVRSGGSATCEQAQRFLRGIQLQASLSHPNIASVHNAFWVNDELVMVMELVEGEPLRKLLDLGRLPLATALNYACQVLAAVSYAHEHGVVHRDITPSNIIVTPDGTLKLTDFGLAKMPDDPTVSQSGSLMGSPHYMSPEQVKGSSELDAKSDIYSVGVVLYEMATGRRPFDGENAFSVMRKQVESAPLPPIVIEPGLPVELNNAILTALEKEPARRFSSASAFSQALNCILSGPVTTQPESYYSPETRRRRALLSHLAVLSAVALTAIFSLIFLVRTWMKISGRTPAQPQRWSEVNVPPVVPATQDEVKPTPLPDSNTATLPPAKATSSGYTPESVPRQATRPVPEPRRRTTARSQEKLSTPPAPDRTRKAIAAANPTSLPAESGAGQTAPAQNRELAATGSSDVSTAAPAAAPKKRRNPVFRVFGRILHPFRK